MKKNVIALLVSLVVVNTAFADYSFVDPSDFTGDSFFTAPTGLTTPKNEDIIEEERSHTSGVHSTPPLKKLRIKVKNKINKNNASKMELAPVAPIEQEPEDVSEFASHEIEDNFDETLFPENFETQDVTIENEKNKKHFWQRKKKNNKSKNKKNNVTQSEIKDTESIVLDCKNISYDADTYSIIARDDVVVDFKTQDTKVIADKITYDRINNTIKAEGNVKILKGNQIIDGEYIFVDMNEENALIEKPQTSTDVIVMKAEKGYVYGDKFVQEHGKLSVDKSLPIKFRTQGRGPRMRDYLEPENKDKKSEVLRLKANEIKITQKGDLEVLSLKKASFFYGKKQIFKIPAVKLYTNKNFDFQESNIWEIGSYRGLGLYTGPGYVFEIPGGSVLKTMPILNYNHDIGIGAIARYSSASNWTQIAYGTANDKFIGRGRQELDDDLYFEYGVNDYMREWFLGRRRAKYAASLVYDKSYSQKDFLIKDQISSFQHRLDFGYYQDSDYDHHMQDDDGSLMGTTRTRYMAQATQNIFTKQNREKQTALSLQLISQMSAAVYGTGDTQVIGRVGPQIHTQYKRWMQDIGYFQSAYEDNSPMPVFDSYRYGKSNVYFRECFKLNRMLTLAWFSSLNVSDDAPNGETFQENSFYVTFGPEDIKFNLGYDFTRKRTYLVMDVLMDAKGTEIEYDRLEIKQDKKAKKEEKVEETNNYHAKTQTPVLRHAIVEDVNTVENVL